MKRAAEPSPAADMSLDYGLAMEHLQRLLPALRSARKDSSSSTTKLQVILDEWRTHAAKQRGSTPPSRVADENWNMSKKQLRKSYPAVMSLVHEAALTERPQLYKFIEMLGSSEGRAELIDMYESACETAIRPPGGSLTEC